MTDCSSKNPAYRAWINQAQMPWPIATTRRYCNVKNGGTPASNVAEFWGGDVMWLTPDDLGRVGVKTIAASQRTLTEEGVQCSNAAVVPKDSLTRIPQMTRKFVG
jgi:hypothetical protein